MKILKILLVMALMVALPMTIAFDGKVANADDLNINDVKAQKEEVIAKIPKTYEEAVKIVPIKNRFLMWTRDLRHIMWGTYGKGYFRGVDNLEKKAWGIYGKHIFAGFYDGHFFYGFYSNGRWRAYGLFGLRSSYGNYVTFPAIIPTLTAEAITE